MIELFWSLVVGGILGMVAAAVLGKDAPGGFAGNVVVGLLGSWFGRILLGPRGPRIGSVYLFPALVGAVLCLGFFFFLRNKWYNLQRDESE